jgi:hypothetical protein
MPLRDDFDEDDDDKLDDGDEFGGDRHTRHYEDLDPQEQQALRNIKSPQDIKSCQIVNDWVDDHLICVGIVLNGVEFGAWWCGWETAAAFMYWEHPKAKEAIAGYIQQTTNDLDEAMRTNAETDAADSGLAPYPGETAEDALRRRQERDPDEITPEDLPQRPQ